MRHTMSDQHWNWSDDDDYRPPTRDCPAVFAAKAAGTFRMTDYPD